MLVSKEKCSQLSDREIVQRSLAELDYFSCLYDRYEQQMMRYIMRIVHVSREEAADILQDAFIKIWRNLNALDPDLKVSSWLYRIVHNEAVSHWRKSISFGKNRQIHIQDIDYEALADDVPEDFETEISAARLSAELLDQLPLQHKTMLVLRYIEGKHYDEISDILKMPEGTVATRINRAKKALAELAARKNISFTG